MEGKTINDFFVKFNKMG